MEQNVIEIFTSEGTNRFITIENADRRKVLNLYSEIGAKEAQHDLGVGTFSSGFFNSKKNEFIFSTDKIIELYTAVPQVKKSEHLNDVCSIGQGICVGNA